MGILSLLEQEVCLDLAVARLKTLSHIFFILMGGGGEECKLGQFHKNISEVKLSRVVYTSNKSV
jgi:hypothetical protein